MSDRPLVIFHAHCADGFTAAWCAWLKFGDGADYLPCNHGDAPPDVRGRDVYILDFSWRAKHLLNMATAARSLTVIDHHASAEQELLALVGCGARVSVVFDVAKSGAMLAWEFFHPGKQSPWIVDYVQDRDTWAWKLPSSREVSAYLGGVDRTWQNWSAHANIPPIGPGWRDMVVMGGAIIRYQEGVIRSHCDRAVIRTIAGYSVPVVNVTTIVSEVVGQLAESAPFAAGYADRLADGLRIWSLRSRGEGGVDVSEIARSFGGGGHRNAAGYQTELPK